jgi:predicted GIY-YIG superfamily endonuclease
MSTWKAREMRVYLYILRCADGSYYVGTTRDSLEKRIAEHNSGAFGGDAARRRPMVLAFQQDFERIEDAVSAERQVKGWRREKKEALIRSDFAALPALAQRRPRVHASRRRAEFILGPREARTRGHASSA